MRHADAAVLDHAREHLGVFVPPTQAQVEMIYRVLVEDGDPQRAATLVWAACFPESHLASGTDSDAVAAIRALRAPAHRDLSAALLRIRRSIDTETEGLYRRKDAGHPGAVEALRSIGFLLLELGFTVAAEGGVDCDRIEATVGQAYDLPGYVDAPTGYLSPGGG